MKSETQVAAPTRNESPPLDAMPIGGGIAALIAIGSTVLWLRRRLSRDGTEIVKDRVEAGLVKTLQEERDKAMAAAAEAWSTRAHDAQVIGELSQKVAHLTEVNELLRREIAEVRNELVNLRNLLCLIPDCTGRKSVDRRVAA